MQFYTKTPHLVNPHLSIARGFSKVVFLVFSMLVAGSSPGVFAGLAALRAASPAKTPGEEPATSI